MYRHHLNSLNQLNNRMINNKQKPVLLTIAMLTAIVAGNIILQNNWVKSRVAIAAVTNGTEQTANTTTGQRHSPDIASDVSNDFVTVWTAEGTDDDVYLRMYNSEGTAQIPNGEADADELLVNETTTGNQNDPAIAMDQLSLLAAGSFAIVWSQELDPADCVTAGLPNAPCYDVYGRAYEADGNPLCNLTCEALISDTPSTVEPHPSISINTNTGTTAYATVTWRTSNGTTDNIVGQRLTATTFPSDEVAAVGGNFIVNSTTTGNQMEPAVAMGVDNGFVISWYGEDDSLPGETHIWYQLYDPAGVALDANTRVDTAALTAGAYRPSIAAQKTILDYEYSYIITYDGNSIDDTSGAIFARVLTCNIDPLAVDPTSCALNPVEVRVNSTTAGVQLNSDVSADWLGNFTVTWRDDNNTNIYGQSFRWDKGEPERMTETYGHVSRYGDEFVVNAAADDQDEPAVTANLDGQFIIAYNNEAAPNTDISFQQYVSDMLKVNTETPANTPDGATTYQSEIDVAMAPNGYHAAVWRQDSPAGIYYTLWDSNNDVVAGPVQINNGGDASAVIDDSNPTISFYQDTVADAIADNVGRFVIAWSGSAPECATPTYSYLTANRDIWYNEIKPDGTLVNSCEKMVNEVTNAITDGNQMTPQIAAGYFNNDLSVNEDHFAVIYYEEQTGNPIPNIVAAYHTETADPPADFTDFAFNGDDCADPISGGTCLAGEQDVAYRASDNKILYVFSDYIGGSHRIGYVSASGGTLNGPSTTVSDPLGQDQFEPSISFLPNNQFFVTYAEGDFPLTSSNIYVTRWEIGGVAAVDNPFSLTNPYFSNVNIRPKVVSDINNGDTFITASVLPVSSIEASQIFAAVIKYKSADTGIEFFNSEPTGLSIFQLFMRVNSTQSGDQLYPSLAMNNYGDVIVGWEGNYQANVGQTGAGDDDQAAIIQTLYNPLYAETYPSQESTAEQTVLGGGRTLTVPSSISFPPATVDPVNGTGSNASIRDATYGGSDNKFIEVQDLDGPQFTLSAHIVDDFTYDDQNPATINDGGPYILSADASIITWDSDDTNTDTGCSLTTRTYCFKTENSSLGTTTFILDSIGVLPLNPQQVLATKGDGEIGKWKIFPEFFITAPANTPPGTHSTTIIFSLT